MAGTGSAVSRSPRRAVPWPNTCQPEEQLPASASDLVWPTRYFSDRLELEIGGEAITDTATIVENFSVLAEALQYIVDYTIDGLNAGKRKDQIYGSVQLPEHLATHPTLNVQYVTANDISKMIIKKYTGWWDDIPSHWTPASMADQEQTGRINSLNWPNQLTPARKLIRPNRWQSP